MKIFNFLNTNKKIKIYYICQYIQGYNKICDVIETMKNDENIDIHVLAFPYEINKFPENKEFDFWKEKFGDIVINAVEGDKWVDLQKEKPDYVFIQRPYDMYLPKNFACSELSKYTKVCYIPYGFSLANLHSISLPPEFLKNIYIFFAEHEDEYKYAKNIMDKFNDGKTRYSLNFGFPVLDNIKEHANSTTSAFKKIDKKNSLNIIWTPRWTTDSTACGTTFFDNKDKIVEYIKSRNNMMLVFRPHPLAFENFLQKGLMTKDEINNYLKNYNNSYMTYDKSSDYYETFKDSDVLITDFSSIIVEYLMYNKPIILCHTDMSTLDNYMKKLCKVCYCVKSWDEIKNILESLKKGKDPLKKNREKFIKTNFGMYDGKITERMIEFIKNDFKKTK